MALLLQVARWARRGQRIAALLLDESSHALTVLRSPIRFNQLVDAIGVERAAVVFHPIYAALRDGPALRIFMRSHVFAVWDFMSLLKSLQRRLTGVDLPWLPPADPAAARLVNEIVLGEESDEIAPGHYVSHFELYLAAMREVGADAAPMCELVEALRGGAALDVALEGVPISRSTREFVRSTFAVCAESAAAIAGAFLLGREQLVPAMFQEILAQLEHGGPRCAAFRVYLERHVEVDSGQHGPMAQRLLARLCGDDEARWRCATESARASLVSRRALWDEVLAEMRR